MYQITKLDNFNIYELVSKQVLDMLGANAWSLFNLGFMKDIDQLCSDLKRDLGCTSVIINDWKWGGPYSQSGFREANGDVGVSKSQHRQGNAFDLKFVGITIDEALAYLVKYQDKYPHIKRYENLSSTRSNNKYGGWLHLDGKISSSGNTGLVGFIP